MAAPLHGTLRGNAGRQDVLPRVRTGGRAAPCAAPRAHHTVSPVGAERRRMGPLVPSVHAGHDLRRGAERQRRAGLAAADASLVALPSLRRARPAAALRAGRHVLRGMARRGIRPSPIRRTCPASCSSLRPRRCGLSVRAFSRPRRRASSSPASLRTGISGGCLRTPSPAPAR